MLAYITRRILLMFPTLLGILCISFLIAQLSPGGPVERLMAQIQGIDSGSNPNCRGKVSDKMNSDQRHKK